MDQEICHLADRRPHVRTTLFTALRVKSGGKDGWFLILGLPTRSFMQLQSVGDFRTDFHGYASNIQVVLSLEAARYIHDQSRD